MKKSASASPIVLKSNVIPTLKQEDTEMTIDTLASASTVARDLDWWMDDPTVDALSSEPNLTKIQTKGCSPRVSLCLSMLMLLVLFLPGGITLLLSQIQDTGGASSDLTTSIQLCSFGLAANWLLGVLFYWILRYFFTCTSAWGFGKCGRILDTVRDYLREIIFWVVFMVTSFTLALTFMVLFPSQINNDWTCYVQKVLWGFFLLGLLLFLQKAMVQYIAISFHKTACSDREERVEFGLKILKRLQNAAVKGAQIIEFYEKNENHRSGTSSPRTMLAKRVRRASEKIWKREMKFAPKASQVKARLLARSIFVGMTHSSCHECITFEDFSPYFEDSKMARRAFEFFTLDVTGNVSKDEMRQGVISIFKEKKALSKTLRDLSQVVGTVDRLLLVLTMAVWLVSCTLILVNNNVLSNILPVWTLFLALSFAFGQSAREVFEALIFLFVTHPYDTGDRVFINGYYYVVKEIRVLTTIFVRSDGQYVFMPNFYLKTIQIINVRRSSSTGETITVQVDFQTSGAKLVALKLKLRDFLEQHSRDFSTDMDVNIVDVVDSNKLTLGFWLEHTKNWQDMSAKTARRNKFMYFLKDALTSLDIRYYHVEQKVQLELSDSLLRVFSSFPRSA